MRLSPSSLNLFLECPKCFWLRQNKGIHRPSGPFPSLPSGMDNLIKKYFDYYRLRGKLPPELRGKVGSAELFPDVEMLDKWRNWRTGLTYVNEESGATLSGAIDDLMVEGDKYVVADYKTRGYDVKPGGEKFYQNQLDQYALLLEKNNMPPTNFAWLIYWIPKNIIPTEEVANNMVGVSFEIVLKKVTTDTSRALEVFKAAIGLLNGPMPQSHSNCSFCSWGTGFLSD